MSDLSIMWKDGEGDVVSLDSALLTDDSLTNAIVISLFTDARVDNQRGWWGNDFNQNEERQVEMGSRLWTLARSKQLADVLEDAQAYAEHGLLMMVTPLPLT